MIESFIGIFSIGLLLGAPSGIAPGPMLVLIISETLRHGIRAGAKVACIPLLTDAPVVLVSGFLFTQISDMSILLGVISLVGFVFLLYLGSKSFRIANAEIPDYTPPPLQLKEIMIANLVNPNPYLFWFTVGAPLMVRSFQQTWGLGLAFLFSFYLGLVGVKILLAVATGKSRNFLHGVLYRRIMQILSLTLMGFAFYLLRDGLIYFGIF
ncbi:MAG: LysE family transporter [SAR324 cluster bacterium]|nr:LysE family transporter [SAR324 cluster bacterium]MBL7034234.1 LysE family transporter [SAR324 cluster bacterium]